MSRYYRLLLDDYSAASFASFDKDYFGTLEDINEFFEKIKSDKDIVKRQKHILSVYEQFLAGKKDISHIVAYREVPFLVPAKVLATETSTLTNHVWEHLNTWRWPYMMKCDKVECTHIWFSCYGKYSRCVKAQFVNLEYGMDSEEYKLLGGMIMGFPGIIAGKKGYLYNTLFVEEKVFKNKSEAMKDRNEFIKKPDPIFSKFLDDIFGDG